MQPFYTVYSPAQMAYATMLDTIWCVGFVVGWCIALIDHFRSPTIVPPSPKCHVIRLEDLDRLYPLPSDSRLSSTVSIG